MMKLPSNWEIGTLSSVSKRPRCGYATRAAPSGTTKFLRTTDITSGNIVWDSVFYCKDEPTDIEKYRLHHGDVVISRAGSVGFSYLVQPEIAESKVVVFASNLVRFQPLIEPRYFVNFLKSDAYWAQISSLKTVVTISTLNSKKLGSVKIPIPPLNEQRRIVEKIETLFEEIDKDVKNLHTAQSILDIYRKSLLKSAFEGRLTSEWRTRNPYKLESPESILEVSAEMNAMPRLPENWMYTKLGHLGNLGRGKSKHRPRNDKRLFGGPYPFIQTGDVAGSDRFVTEYQATYSEFGLAQSKLWPKGTLCITIAANIAETAFLTFDACFPDSVVGFSAFERIVMPKFVELFIKNTRPNIEASTSATAQKNINLGTLETLVIPICGMSEQAEIVRILDTCFDVIDRLSKEIDAALAWADTFRQFILKKAFAGQLVSQDPTDEPASVLLARIGIG